MRISKYKAQVSFTTGFNKNALLHWWWASKLVQPLWNTIWRYFRKLNIELLYDPAIPLLGIYPEKTFIQKDTCGVPALAQQK